MPSEDVLPYSSKALESKIREMEGDSQVKSGQSLQPPAVVLVLMANALLDYGVRSRGRHRGKKLAKHLLAAVDHLEAAAEVCALEEIGEKVNSSEAE